MHWPFYFAKMEFVLCKFSESDSVVGDFLVISFFSDFVSRTNLSGHSIAAADQLFIYLCILIARYLNSYRYLYFCVYVEINICLVERRIYHERGFWYIVLKVCLTARITTSRVRVIQTRIHHTSHFLTRPVCRVYFSRTG